MKKMPKKYKNARERENAESSGALMIKQIMGTFLLTLATGGALLLLCSLILYFIPDPLSLVLPTGLLCAALTSFLGGFWGTRTYHLPALSVGLINGILLTALALLLSFFFAKNADCYATGYSAAVSALLHAGVVGLSIGGALIGAREKTPIKKRKKMRR